MANKSSVKTSYRNNSKVTINQRGNGYKKTVLAVRKNTKLKVKS